MDSTRHGHRKVHIWEYSRLNLEYDPLKRKLQWFVDNKHATAGTILVSPVQGVVRRGMQVDALKEFMISQGASKTSTSWSGPSWAMNKKIIDPIAPRPQRGRQNRRRQSAQRPEGEEWFTAPKHKKNPDVGIKVVLRRRNHHRSSRRASHRRWRRVHAHGLG